jgi:hypothetical protein
LEAGWLAVWDAEWKTGFGMTFPTEVFKSVWVWVVDGGWRGIRCVAVEPWTGFPNRLDAAIQAGRATELGPGEVMEVSSRLIGFECQGAIEGFDGDGQVVLASEGEER